jgi:hypothetical protein
MDEELVLPIETPMDAKVKLEWAPHNVLLYRNLLPSRDPSPRQ